MNSSWWNKIYTPLIIAFVFVVGMSVGKRFLSENTYISHSNNSKIQRILQYIEDDYVDTVKTEEIEDQAIRDIIDGLDPHSSYISPENYHSFVDPLLGNFEGIGIQFRMIRDSLTVMIPLEGGPSEKAGIKAGDKIVIADGDTIAHRKMSSNDVIKKLKGERGSQVSLQVHRSQVDSLLSFDVIRDVIPTFSLDAKFMIDEKLGYIKISKFSATTIEEFDEAISDLLRQGMEKLILDLRGNSGGYLKAAISMADTFLKEGKLIVYTKGKNRPEKKYFADNHGDFEEQELIILIDENAASASEIVAGAIQDNDRGQIVGRRSFGKGLVQEQMNFSDGSAVRLTVARYYTPTGRCIQRSYAEGTDAYYADHYHRILDDLSSKNDSIQELDSLMFTTPKGKVVYGGGGIMPDVSIPLDTTFNFYFYNRLIRSSVIVEYAIDYYNHHHKELNLFTDSKDFYKNHQLSSSIYTEIVKKAKQQDIETSAEEIVKNKEIISNIFKAELARLLFKDEGYYFVYLQKDEVYGRALELVNETKE
ncbi:MAG: PDZ domain-containing protein [Bacteroidales bacterium]|nr:PDZ domain-containing protein [Bacteroidales bacterium]